MRPLSRAFFKYAGLNVAGMLGLSCYILADTFFVSVALGAEGLAALNFSLSMFSVLQGVGLMLGVGGATDFSLSRQRQEGAGRDTSLTHALALGAVAAAAFLLVGLFLTGPLARALGAQGSALPLTVSYLSVLLAFSPLFLLNNILLAFVRNDHNPQLSMTAMLVSSLSNVILDYVFIFPLGMGMAGAALATGLSPAISLGVLSLHLRGKRRGFHLARRGLRWGKCLRLLSLGVSSLMGELASAIALIVFNLMILGIAGTTGVAAYGVVANLALVATAIFVGLGQGLQPLASRYHGTGDTASVCHLLRLALLLAAGLSLLLYALLALWADPLVAVFNSQGSLPLAQLAQRGVRLYFLGYLFAGGNIVAAAFLSATARAPAAIAVALLRSCALLIPAVLLLGALWGMDGVWLSFVATELCAAFCAGIFLFSARRKSPSPLKDAKP